MRGHPIPSAVLLTVLFAAVAAAAAPAGDLPELKFEKFVLDNGLQVILHEDHTIPMVSVNVWYHVGSKNEKPGRTGFAHVFEHMMFQGSEHHDDDFFMPLQKIGGRVNGSTTEDRTNYWENVPADRLELALFLESDRMGWLLPAMTQEKLDNQKDVVKNEKRQGENEPYAKSDELLLKMLYPQEHPYSWTVIGSMDDLSAASKEDVSDFFRLYYAPNNASLCVAGDIDPAATKELITRYFGPIPPGRPVDRLARWIPTLDGERRTLAEDAVELPRLYMAWHSPAWYQAGDAEFDLLGSILSRGKTSRLYQRLVYDLQIAQDVNARQDSRELSGVFTITATAAPGHTLAELEAVIDQELTRLLAKGVTKKELELARTQYEAGFVRRLERVGGFGGKADMLNNYNTFTGDPGFLEQDLARYLDVTTDAVGDAAGRYLGLDNRAVLHIVPQGTLKEQESTVARTGLPAPAGDTAFTPPTIQHATLENGLELYLVEKRDLPLCEVHLVVRSGWSADPANKPGTAALTADLLDEGVRGLDALQISEAEEALGARLNTGSFFDGSTVSLNVLKSKLSDGLLLMSRVALEPTFPQADFDRLKQNYAGRQKQESVQPNALGIKELQKRLFGSGHPYAQPFTGTGTAEALAALTTADLAAFHRTWYRPNNAAVVVVGDLDLEEARAALGKVFGRWQAGELPRREFPAPRGEGGARLVVIDRPGAQQSTIVAGCPSLKRSDPDFQDFQVMNTAFGGQFSCRINMNLREDKGYTYGVRSQLAAFRDGGMFLITAPVHTQFTRESVAELIREMKEIRGERPLSAAELADSRTQVAQSFPQQFETLGGVAGSLDQLLLNATPLDEWQTFAARVAGCSDEDAARVVQRSLDPDRLTWIIVGDWRAIEAGLRELGLGEIEVIEAGRS